MTGGRIPDKWSMRILWMTAIGSAVGLYMVVVERQLRDKERKLAAALAAAADEVGDD